MARAKRTDRAEARRRYRAQLAEQAREPDEEIDEADATAVRPSRPSATGKAPAPAATQPAGIGYAFRAAFHQPNYREDIAYLPKLILHPSVWAPVLLTLAVATVFLATGGREIISSLAIQYFVAPPPIGAIFIAGFFAPRASYLAGGLVGLVSALALAGMIALAPPSLLSADGSPSASASPGPSPSVAGVASANPEASAASPNPASATASAGGSAAPSPSAAPSASPAPSPTPSPATGTVIPTRMSADQALGYALAVSPLSGVFFGAAAAWYRRFLRLANPNRGRPTSRQAQRRRR